MVYVVEPRDVPQVQEWMNAYYNEVSCGDLLCVSLSGIWSLSLWTKRSIFMTRSFIPTTRDIHLDKARFSDFKDKGYFSNASVASWSLNLESAWTQPMVTHPPYSLTRIHLVKLAGDHKGWVGSVFSDLGGDPDSHVEALMGKLECSSILYSALGACDTKISMASLYVCGLDGKRWRWENENMH
ncbi:hypothetical protein AAG906_016747 [Vitis piasezkii]